jgi:hypothetical protein
VIRVSDSVSESDFPEYVAGNLSCSIPQSVLANNGAPEREEVLRLFDPAENDTYCMQLELSDWDYELCWLKGKIGGRQWNAKEEFYLGTGYLEDLNTLNRLNVSALRRKLKQIPGDSQGLGRKVLSTELLENGDTCGSLGTGRTSSLWVQCGTGRSSRLRLVAVLEPRVCHYVWLVETPTCLRDLEMPTQILCRVNP